MSPVDGNPLSVVILAAGAGRRLGRPFPKAVTPLVGVGTILEVQLAAVRVAFGPAVPLHVVVGFRAESVRAAFPALRYVRNELWEHTDTAHGLRCALRLAPPGGVLWLPGDVVLEPAVPAALRKYVVLGESCAAVIGPTGRPAGVRYTVDPDGRLRQLVPGLPEGIGELAGVNYVAPADRARFGAALEACAPTDRAEYALAIAIGGGMVVHPVEVGDLALVDVDTDADLRRAEALFGRRATLPGQRRITSADGVRG
jgi:CDP-glycerol glycerophosphotransferase